LSDFASLNIPDGEVFHQISTHFQNWGSQHQEFMQQLDTGHSSLREGWEGDGAETYTQLHTHIQQVGNKHVERMQQATDRGKRAGTSLNDAKDKQKKLWIALGVGLGVGVALAIFSFGFSALADGAATAAEVTDLVVEGEQAIQEAETAITEFAGEAEEAGSLAESGGADAVEGAGQDAGTAAEDVPPVDEPPPTEDVSPAEGPPSSEDVPPVDEPPPTEDVSPAEGPPSSEDVPPAEEPNPSDVTLPQGTKVYHGTDGPSAAEIVNPSDSEAINGIQPVENQFGGGELGPGFYTTPSQDGAIAYTTGKVGPTVIEFETTADASGSQIESFADWSQWANPEREDLQGLLNENDFLTNDPSQLKFNYGSGTSLLKPTGVLLPEGGGWTRWSIGDYLELF
jgi:uncharacterized protein YukE